MTKIGLKFTDGRIGIFKNSLRARIVLKVHQKSKDGLEHFLSAECASAIEVEAQANYLKSQLDKIIHTAKRKFPA